MWEKNPFGYGKTFLLKRSYSKLKGESKLTKSEEHILTNYHILAVAPHHHVEFASVIYTPHEKFYSTYTVKKIVDKYCLLNGASLAGRMEFARKIFKDVKNPSVLVSGRKSIAGFQVPSTDKLDKIWIFDVNHVKIEPTAKGESVIILSNQEKIVCPLASNLVVKRKEKALSLIYRNAFHILQPKLHFNLVNDFTNPYR